MTMEIGIRQHAKRGNRRFFSIDSLYDGKFINQIAFWFSKEESARARLWTLAQEDIAKGHTVIFNSSYR